VQNNSHESCLFLHCTMNDSIPKAFYYFSSTNNIISLNTCFYFCQSPIQILYVLNTTSSPRLRKVKLHSIWARNSYLIIKSMLSKLIFWILGLHIHKLVKMMYTMIGWFELKIRGFTDFEFIGTSAIIMKFFSGYFRVTQNYRFLKCLVWI